MHARASTALVTGCAGFLGSHLSEALLRSGHEVIGVDCFSDYYPRAQKEANLEGLWGSPGFSLVEADLAQAPLEPLLDRADLVFHLAAQPGVRPSFGRGFTAYLRDNVEATQRLLAAAAETALDAFVYASSSSVYGDQEVYPVREDAPLRPVSPYGATKVITEQLAGAFWRSAEVPVVGLRYFTVYGPRQRPDMAFSRFLTSARAGRTLTVLGDGRQVREFTYVGDVVAATIAAATRGVPGSVYNIGGGEPVALLDVIELLGTLLGERPAVEHRAPGPGDPRRTHADITRAIQDLGYRPGTPLGRGLSAQLAVLALDEPDDDAPRHHGQRRRHVRVPRGAQGARGPRVLAYSHDGYGLGHLRRNLRLVGGLRRQRPDVEAMLVTGARSARRLVHGSEIACVQLPPVLKVGNGRYVPEGGGRTLPDVLRLRAEIITAAVSVFEPDLILVDRYPRGMQDEALPALEAHAAQRPHAPVVLGLRDILDSRPVVQEEWHRGRYSEAIREHYAAVLCYGDRTVYDPIGEYGLPDDVAQRVRFTGYLADELLVGDAADVRRRHRAQARRLAVCTLGGGKDAGEIAQTFLTAIERLRDRGWAGVLITGPYMSRDELERLTRHPVADHVAIIPLVDDVPSYLAAADVAVTMGGYNTSCELLALAVPAVVIPRITPRSEQRMRAERMAARGLVSWLHPDELHADVLAQRVEQAAARPRAALIERLGGIARRGVHAAAGYLAELLPEPTADGLPERVDGQLQTSGRSDAIG